MAVVVLAAEVVDVRRRHQRPAELACHPDDPLVRLVLLGHAVALHLEVDLLGTECLDQVVDVCAGVVGPVLDQATAEARLEAACKRDHALGVSREQLHVDVRLPAGEALEEAGGAELDQVAEAGIVRCEQGEVVALVARGLRGLDPVVDQIGLDSDDRLDSRSDTRLVVLDRAVHDPVVGQPQRRHVQLGGAGRELVDLAGPVEQRVLAVDVQMDRSGAHPSIMPSRGDRIAPKRARSTRAFRTRRRNPRTWRVMARIGPLTRQLSCERDSR
jgi:hypothetical protein